jgi:8-oxo-dGTP pyrophosphatase MutT (NUDIX family)
VIRSAGGVVLRDGCVLVVHRPKYDDWSLPKGKLEPDESLEEAAVREVFEETGLQCELGPEVGRTHYAASDGSAKEVCYFLMTASGEPLPATEVDELRWVPLADAPALLTYERDVEVLSRLP